MVTEVKQRPQFFSPFCNPPPRPALSIIDRYTRYTLLAQPSGGVAYFFTDVEGGGVTYFFAIFRSIFHTNQSKKLSFQLFFHRIRRGGAPFFHNVSDTILFGGGRPPRGGRTGPPGRKGKKKWGKGGRKRKNY